MTAKSNEGWKCEPLLTLLRARASQVYYLFEQKENYKQIDEKEK